MSIAFHSHITSEIGQGPKKFRFEFVIKSLKLMTAV